VVEAPNLGSKLSGGVSQTAHSRKLRKHHGTELLPAIQGSILSLAWESLSFDAFENMSINKLEQLMKNCVTMCHGLILLLCQWVMGKTTIPQNELSGLFSIP